MPTKQTTITKYYKKGATQSRRKRFYKKSIRKNMNTRKDLYFFKRSFAQATLTGNAVFLPYLGGVSWTLSQLPGVNDFTNLFDRYKITYIKLYFHLQVDPSAQTSTTAIFPKLYYVKDFDDASAPASLNQLREHSRCQIKVLNPNRPVVIRVKPSILSEVYRSAVATSYSPQWNKWVDMATTDIPYYGLKIGIDNFTNPNYTVDIQAKMWFQCKDIR